MTMLLALALSTWAASAAALWLSWSPRPTAVRAGLAVLPALPMVALLALLHGAVACGSPVGGALSAGVSETAAHVASGHVLTDADELAPGSYAVLVRYGCPDCEGAKDALDGWARGRDVLWVGSRTDFGRELLQEAEEQGVAVPEVPWVLWRDEDGALQGCDGTDMDALVRLTGALGGSEVLSV